MLDFEVAPFLVIWEVTQACDLACRHCRASAEPVRDPEELTTEEGYRLLDEIRRFGDPLMVFTGGDPLKRPDLRELLGYSSALGLRTTVTPSATPLLTAGAIRGFQSAGVQRMALSLDGPDAASHDGFRGVAGSFDRTLYGLETARQLGLETQINTTVTRHNVARLAEMADLVAESGARLWSVFFLVPVGRAGIEDDLTGDEYEQVFAFLAREARRRSFLIKTTEAPHYRRFAAQHGAPMKTAAIRDGRGICFVSHRGEIYPSGFLPVSAGNVRRDSLVEVYRCGPLFTVLRDSDALGGKCGECDYRKLCGGSRARAWAMTGDWMAEEPRCTYEPAEVTA